MCKRKYIVFTVAVGAVAICTQVMAQTPADLRAIQEIADKALNAHDLDRWLSYFTDDAVFEWTPAPAPFTGKAEIRAFFESVFTGFPDFGTTEGRVFAAGQVVVVEHSTTGTQRGVWQGIPPTGNSAPMPHVDVYDYEGNRIKHAITYADAGGVMMQLGVMPVPAAPKLIPSFAPPSPEPTGLRPLDAVVEAIARWNTHDLVRYAKMVRSDATFFIAPFGVPMDRNGWLGASELYFQGFSNVRLDITRKLDLGEGWVLVEGVAHGTQDGPFLGIPPSGVATSVRAGFLFQIDSEGRLQLMNDYYDNLSVLAQIMPKCPPAPAIPDCYIQDKITSPSLAGNLLGDPAARPLLVYLPPSYASSPEKRYPTIYLLHAFLADETYFTSGSTASAGIKALTGIDLGVDVRDIVVEMMRSGYVDETIIVMPNAVNCLGGSMYESSPLIGDYRSYIAKDLVAYIDGKYRTIADRRHRAIAGHSMGGYSALSLAIEYPNVFGAVAALSPGTPLSAMVDRFLTEYPLVLGLPIVGSTLEDRWNTWLSKFNCNILYALAAAWSPNLDKPPFYVDFPVRYPEKTIVPEVWDKWLERDVVHQIERDGINLAATPIFIDEGRGPTVLMAEEPVDRILTALYDQGISYTYNASQGDHLTHLRDQLASALRFLYPHIALEAK